MYSNLGALNPVVSTVKIPEDKTKLTMINKDFILNKTRQRQKTMMTD